MPTRKSTILPVFKETCLYLRRAVWGQDRHELLIARVVIPALNEVQGTIARSKAVHGHGDVMPVCMGNRTAFQGARA